MSRTCTPGGGLRMLLIRFPGELPAEFPADLELTVRERNGQTCLLEHRGAIGPLLRWLGSVPVEDVAIGTEDLHSLYNQFHGPDVVDDEEMTPMTPVPGPAPQARPRHAVDARPLGGRPLRPGLALRLLHLAQRDRDPQGPLASNPEDNRFRWMRNMGMMEDSPIGLDHDGLLVPPVHPPDALDLGDRPRLDRRGRPRSSGAPSTSILSRPVSRTSLPGFAYLHRRARAARPALALAAGASDGRATTTSSASRRGPGP